MKPKPLKLKVELDLEPARAAVVELIAQVDASIARLTEALERSRKTEEES